MPWPNDVFLTFANRWVHVLGMAWILGGSLMLFGLAMTRRTGEHAGFDRLLLRAAHGYERAFWLAIGLIVLTGVGNIGAFAGHLPSQETVWGGRFVVKLFAVLVLMIVSLARTLWVSRLEKRTDGALVPAARKGVQVSYAGTAVLAGLVFTLALKLAHG